MYDEKQIEGEARSAAKVMLESTSVFWHRFGTFVRVRPEGEENCYIGADHPICEGEFYIPASDLLPLSIALRELWKEHMKRSTEAFYEETKGKSKQIKSVQS